MSSRRRDLGGSSGDALAADVGEVRDGRWARRRDALLRRDRFPAQMADGRVQVVHGDDADALHGGGLDRIGGRHHDLLEAGVSRGQGHAERAAYRAHLSVQPQLADEHAPHGVGRAHAAEPQEAHGDRQVQRGAALAKVGRGEVDGHRPDRHREAAVLERRADALSRLAHGRVGEAHDREPGQAVAGVDLHVEDTGLQAERRGGVDSGEHADLLGAEGRPDRGGMRTAAILAGSSLQLTAFSFQLLGSSIPIWLKNCEL